MITFTTDITKMTTNITSFNIIAAVWSFCLLIFRLPMATNRIPTNSCQDWNGNRLGKQRSSTKHNSIYVYSRCVAIILLSNIKYDVVQLTLFNRSPCGGGRRLSNADIKRFIMVVKNANPVRTWLITFADWWNSGWCSRQSRNKLRDRLNMPDSI